MLNITSELQSPIIDLSDRKDIETNQTGICFGLAVSSIMAFLSSDSHAANFLLTLKSIIERADSRDVLEIEQERKIEKLLREINAIQKSPINIMNEASLLPELGNYKILSRITGCHTKDDLIDVLTEVATLSSTQKIAFLVDTPSHIIAVVYDPNSPHGEKWIHIDANTGIQQVNQEQLAANIFKSLNSVESEEMVLCAIRFIESKYAPINAALEKLTSSSRWGAIHKVTPDKAKYVASTGASWLYQAVDNVSVVGELLKNGANSEQGPRFTPLIIAAQWGQSETIKMLIENGANINYETPLGTSALSMAIQVNRLEIVKLLCELNAETRTLRPDKISALLYAADLGFIDIAGYLLQNNLADIDYVSTYGTDALAIAIGHRNKEMVKLLINHGANINKIFSNGWSLFLRAVEAGELEIVSLLWEKGIDLDYMADGADALYIAAQNGHHDVVDFLIEKGMWINSSQPNGLNAFLQAANFGRVEVIKSFLAKGADINQCDMYFDWTALTCAVDSNHVELVKYLLSKGADVCYRSKLTGDTPLSIAFKKGNLDVVIEIFRKIGDYPLIKGLDGTHLEFAIEFFKNYKEPLPRDFLSKIAKEKLILIEWIKNRPDANAICQSIVNEPNSGLGQIFRTARGHFPVNRYRGIFSAVHKMANTPVSDSDKNPSNG